MAIDDINLGSAPNANDGDTLRGGGAKINATNTSVKEEFQTLTSTYSPKVSNYSGDVDDIPGTSILYCSGGANRPVSTNGFCETWYGDNDLRMQSYLLANTNTHYRRFHNGSVWSSWVLI